MGAVYRAADTESQCGGETCSRTRSALRKTLSQFTTVMVAGADSECIELTSFKGNTRPVPTSVFDFPTVRVFLWIRSTCCHFSSRNSL